MIRMEWIIFLQFIIGSLMLLLLHNQMKMYRQLNEIAKEVTTYIAYITEDIEAENVENASNIKRKEIRNEEAQNQLIQAVLREFFP